MTQLAKQDKAHDFRLIHSPKSKVGPTFGSSIKDLGFLLEALLLHPIPFDESFWSMALFYRKALVLFELHLAKQFFIFAWRGDS